MSGGQAAGRRRARAGPGRLAVQSTHASTLCESRRFPFMCSLRTKKGKDHICGASLIAPRLALTAAYCVTAPGGVPQPQLWCGLQRQSQPPASFDALQAVRTIV